MKIKKFWAVLAAACLTLALLAGCGGGSSSAAAKSVDEVYAAVTQANAIDNPRELGDNDLMYDYLLSMDDIAEYKGVVSNDSYNAGLVLVIRCAEGKAETVRAALEEYRQSWLTLSANYSDEYAEAVPHVENGVLQASGDMVVMAWASNECAAPDKLADAVAAALG